MCLVAGMFGATAAAAASAQAITGLAISAASAVAGVAQGQASLSQQRQQFNYQQEMNNRQMDMQYQNAQRQAAYNRQAQVSKYMGEAQAHHASTLAYQQQVMNNSEAANRVYVAEQVKMQEAATKAAFKSQAIYAKSIGAMGTVLASGQVGQSVGLMALDTERQAGFGIAEQNASLDSAQLQAATAMQAAESQNKSENNLAASKLPQSPLHPALEMEPGGFGTRLNLGIPSYNWA